MSTKLIVHKLENDNEMKTLQIEIKDEDSGSQEILYSQWIDSETSMKSKNSGKTSHLVVKIVTENECNNFGLDKCAQMLNNTVMNTNINSNLCASEVKQSDFHTNIYTEDTNLDNVKNVNTCKPYSDGETLSTENIVEFYDFENNNVSPTCCTKKNGNIEYDDKVNVNNKLESIISPLEPIIQKVKENNAQIMKNIHMLNNSLKYTKKQEDSEHLTGMHKCERKDLINEPDTKRHKSGRHLHFVWACIKCFQVWPHANTAREHSEQHCISEVTSGVQEIKTSSLLQCEFCEKVFTSIPHLLGHFKLHTTFSNYECSMCELSFMSFKSAEQHWNSCAWLNVFYNFTMPKILLCHVCKRRFKKFQLLYNHRYKAGHFMTKTYCCKNENFETLGLVYQCEICAHWFHSTALLLTHKNIYHPH